MTLRCAVLDDYQGVALSLADWSPLAGKVEVRALREHLADRDQLVAALADCEIVVAMRERTPFDADLLRRLPRLRLLVTTGMRNASIDLAAAAAAGVTVCGTASGSTPPVELTWALILGLARQVPAESRALREGGWQSTVGQDLHGRTLGLIGLGKIGGRVARVATAFGMDVLAWSRNLTPERAAEAGARLAAGKEDLLRRSDVVSLHLVLSERTRGLLGEAELRAMRPHAYLVNTSRAGLVDQAALLRALREGWIAGAGLDVFETEPLPAGDPLRALPNVLATPHLGYVTEGNYRTYYTEAVEDIAAFLSGSPVRELTAR
ncbi:D-2-hydroxyacid dehydrogenase family protein [Nonomuraea roseoviolacea subsp. roseoviolacea]|uniref:Phosphoglycerate dehydrogenase-like enzyme n=1 Tax=Nonomuraea roseoviolacea subsp. carminata TaxID=160689 RepID=A0ABT1KFK1_9ACTN|nr:D-2-hydroxyacid dehydrogenase family protein [Nonomuraea roseoviolacea]MCP2352735.1 phosphoglycerate dehydrogenase-like enzyme [Nonomuraea roseoviolacea subsp. carminata]